MELMEPQAAENKWRIPAFITSQCSWLDVKHYQGVEIAF